jgi:hypothetical protein
MLSPTISVILLSLLPVSNAQVVVVERRRSLASRVIAGIVIGAPITVYTKQLLTQI